MYLDLLSHAALNPTLFSDHAAMLSHTVFADSPVFTQQGGALNQDTLASVLETEARRRGKGRRRGGGLFILGGVCCLLVVALIVAGIYFLVKRKK
ncbi:hypothetical protein [Nocardia callitridis]|uniref:Uncharacterized protein n=1 Tax=Nocardia callitridis TaxID=648753 RepID=A0ABP9K0X0_9NOCA